MQQCITLGGSKIFEKKSFGTTFEPKGPKLGPKLGVLPFLKFGLLVVLEIAYNDSLQQYGISSRSKIHEKKKLGPKSGLKLGFLPFS